jgi:hypothetical protein
MPSGSGRFFRDNAFLVAAVALPLVVVAFFLLASFVPRWLVPPPTHDLLLRVDGNYDRAGSRVIVDYTVRDGRVEATVRPLAANVYLQPAALFLVDHATMTAREIPVDLPADMAENDSPRTFVVEGLAGRTVLAQPVAPDGYQLAERTRGGPGLIGEVFGMNRYDRRAALVNRGRVVPIVLPPRYQYFSPVQVVGWVVPGQDDGRR